MTALPLPRDFLDFEKLPQTASPDQLRIPETPLGVQRGQGYDLRVGDEWLVFGPEKRIVGHYVVRRWWEEAGGRPRYVELENAMFGWALRLTDWQINWLEKQGRFRHNFLSPDGHPDRGILPGSALSLNGKELAFAEYWLGFVEASIAHCDGGDLSPTGILEGAKAHAAKLGVRAPCLNSLNSKIDLYLTRGFFDPIIALAPKRRRGNPGSRFGPLIDSVISEAVATAWKTPGGTWHTVESEFWRILKEHYPNVVREWETQKTARGKPLVLLPSERTLQRRFAAVDHYTRDFWRYGPEYAKKRHAAYIRQVLPDQPLDIVDVDHVTVDLFLIDDSTGTAYGRPDLVVFRDRRTGVVLGYAISFGPPSYESFLEGLRHAWFQKNMSEFPGCEWPYFGRFVKLGVDNAFHLIKDNIQNASKQLRFEIVEYRPGQPWMKGALERLCGILNTAVSHRLRGSTEGSPAERAKFDAERKQSMPVLTLREFEAFLVTYICTIYHHTAHEGVGMLRTLSGVPDKLWKEGIESSRLRTPGDVDVFTRLAGDTARRTIQSIGIEWDHITYQAAELRALAAHPRHKEGSKRHDATRYEVTRDPSDLGAIWVRNPHTGDMVRVPACGADLGYASGLNLSKHRALIQHHNETVGTPANVEKLKSARHDFELMLVELHDRRRKAGTAAKLARFVGGQARRLLRSAVIEADSSEEASAQRVDFGNPAKRAPKPRRSIRAMATAVPVEAKPQKASSVPPVVSPNHFPAPSSDSGEPRPTSPSPSNSEQAHGIDGIVARHPEWDI